MLRILLPLAWLAWPVSAVAQETFSEYTDLDAALHCSTFAMAGPDDGDWSNLACAGYRGYPMLVYYADARESVFYGFPPAGDLAPAWESFGAFNAAGPRVEWRIERDPEGRETPFATIHRWFVETGDTADPVEVLVVEKVGQIHERLGCAVGYVAASGNPDANEAARRIADEVVRGFACGEDDPVVQAGSVPVPERAYEER